MRLAQATAAVTSARKSRHRFAGFTLLELMVVVAIIGITAALAAPAVTQAMAISRADRANHDVIRLVRLARSEAIGFGRAHLVHLDTGGDGRLELWRGSSSLCRTQDWPTTMGAGPCSTPSMPGGNCVDYVDSLAYGTGTHGVRFAMQGNLVDICFQSNGEAVVRAPGGAGVFTTPVGGLVQINTLRYDAGGATPDPLRGCVIPSGGAPRILR